MDEYINYRLKGLILCRIIALEDEDDECHSSWHRVRVMIREQEQEQLPLLNSNGYSEKFYTDLMSKLQMYDDWSYL